MLETTKQQRAQRLSDLRRFIREARTNPEKLREVARKAIQVAAEIERRRKEGHM